MKDQDRTRGVQRHHQQSGLGGLQHPTRSMARGDAYMERSRRWITWSLHALAVLGRKLRRPLAGTGSRCRAGLDATASSRRGNRRLDMGAGGDLTTRVGKGVRGAAWSAGRSARKISNGLGHRHGAEAARLKAIEAPASRFPTVEANRARRNPRASSHHFRPLHAGARAQVFGAPAHHVGSRRGSRRASDIGGETTVLLPIGAP